MERDNLKKLTKVTLVFIGLSLTVPILLTTTIVLVVINQLQNNQPPNAISQTAPQDYANSFRIIIREKDQNIHIWARNLNGTPDFRQVIEANGKIVSQQLYVSAEKTLYSSQQNSSQESEWDKTGNLEPEDIGISSITAGPAVWALQYGVGNHQIALQQGSLSVTIKSVNEPINDAVFQPAGAIDLN